MIANLFLLVNYTMPFVDNILEKIGLSRKSNASGIPLSSGIGGADPFILWRRQKKIPAQKAFEVYSGWVYACIRAIAEELANMKFRLFEVKKDGTNEELFEHELLDILDAVNQFQTGYELKYQTAAHLEVCGNSYWLLDGVKSETDKPTAIYVLPPQQVKIIKAPLPEFIKGYKYEFDGTTKIFQTYEILHHKYPDPSDPYEGIGTVQSIAQWIDADNYAMEFNRRFFLNGARLGGFLESESAKTPEQLDYLKKSFEGIYKGVENAYKVAALPTGTKFQEAQQGQKDLDFANLMTMMRDRILAGFRVPRTALGITDDVNRANAEATNYVFALRTIKPKMELLVSYLNEFLVPRYGDNLYLSFEDPVPENMDMKIREMQAATGSQPIISVNEGREEYMGLGPVENGENVMTDFSKVPLGKPIPKAVGEKPKVKVTGKPSRKKSGAKMRKDIAGKIAEQALKEITVFSEKLQETKNKDITKLNDEEYGLVWKAFLTRVTPYEKAQAEAVKKFNKDQKKEVIENLSSAIKAKDVNEDYLFNLDNSISAVIDLSTPILTELFSKEGKAAAELIGVDDIDVLTPEARKALNEAIGLMARKYNETTMDLLKSKLEAGISEGMGLDKLKDVVSEVYDFSDEIRAEQVARTETFRVANSATKEAWKQTGVVKSIKWYTASDERVCPYCESMNGKVIGIDDNFFDKGEEVTGSDGSKFNVDYSDVGAPPLHVSCRCYTRPEEITLAQEPEETKEQEEETGKDEEIDQLIDELKQYDKQD